MRRILPLALLALTVLGGTAFADRDGRRDRRSDRVERRIDRRADRFDRRMDRRVVRQDRRADRFDRRMDRRFDRRVNVQRARPTFRNNRFYFNGGSYVTYRRPMINVRYRNYYQRPALIVENYDPVPGYIWVRGHWYWSGFEWLWAPGHYEVDASYQYYTY